MGGVGDGVGGGDIDGGRVGRLRDDCEEAVKKALLIPLGGGGVAMLVVNGVERFAGTPGDNVIPAPRKEAVHSVFSTQKERATKREGNHGFLHFGGGVS